MRRGGEPIKEAGFQHIKPANPNITSEIHFLEWEAAIAAGASLDELARLEEYPKNFRAKLIAWHEYHALKELHIQDAATPPPKGKR